MLDAKSISPRTSRRTARAVGRDAIVIARIGAESVRGSNRDRGRFNAWRVDLSINFLARGVLSVVAGRDNHDYACINQPAHGAAYRIVLIGVNSGCAQTHIDDADVVGCFVSRDPVQRRECTRDRSRTLRVQHTQIDQICIGRDSEISGVRNTTIAGGNRRDVRAMTIGIINPVFAGEVLTIDDAHIVALVQEIRMTRVNT